MTVQEIQEYIDNSIQESEQVGMSGYDSALYLKNSMRTVRSMLDELEPKEEWTDIEKSLECLRVEMLNLPTDFDKTVADDHLESLRYIFITQFKENNK